MNIPSEIQWIIGMIVGAVCSYFGAMNAIREDLARLKAESVANKEDSQSAFSHAQRAHDRIDGMLRR